MMGQDQPPQRSLFYTGINLDKQVRREHVLRKVAKLVDFEFVYGEVKEHYGYNGNVSVAPRVILKLMMLLVLYNVGSERELMATLPERLDWLWFLGLDLDSEVPHPSVLSKARKRWGVELFRSFFERIVWQCVENGLVDGRKLSCDSSLVQADAWCNSIVDTEGLRRYLNPAYRELEKRLEEQEKNNPQESNDSDDDRPRRNVVNQRYISTTDPEASIVRKGQGKAKLHYQTHRGIDGAYGIITATVVGRGDENEAHRLRDLIEAHQDHTGHKVEVVIADSKYGTTANFLACHDRGVSAHMPVLKQIQDQQERRRKIFLRVVLFTMHRVTLTDVLQAKLCVNVSIGRTAKLLNMSPQKESVRRVVYALNAPNPRVVDELSNGMSAKSCWIIYVLMLEVPWRDETLGFVSILWRVHLPKRHGSD